MSLHPLTRLAAAGVAVGLALVASPAVAKPPTTPAPAPTFTNATVHDPDHIEVDGTHYVFGSHLAAASSTDLMHWNQIAEGVDSGNPLFEDVTVELAEALEWAQSDTLWAPDVIQLADGKFYMYYNACKGDSPRSAMGIAVADEVTGPYRDLGLILKSGMWGQPSEDGTIYDAQIHPNVVDPDVFFDQAGRLWMTYGSFSGGIFSLELDPASGFPLPDQGYGKHLWGGNHSRIEGPAVHYRDGYYYLFVTYGGLDASGGYNIRVARSTSPDGPFLDADGRDMATVKSDPAKPLFDDASIAESAVKLAGNHLFARTVGDPGSGPGTGYVSPGGSTAFVDDETGRTFLAFHTRFPFRGEEHQVRVHELLFDADGWPTITPLRYGGEIREKTFRSDMVGSWAVVDHAPRTIDTDLHRDQPVTFTQQGRITGALSGTWEKLGRDKALLSVDGDTFEVAFTEQWDADRSAWVPTFTGIKPDGAALWGVKRTPVSPAEAVARVVADLEVPESTITNLTLPTIGTQGSTISWASSDPAVISAEGNVTRPAAGEPDAVVTLTATVTNGSDSAVATFVVTVPARRPGGLVASYSFDGDLAEASGRPAGEVAGPRIGAPGGTAAYETGVAGQAFRFDGATGVRLPDGLVSGGTWSVSLWLKPESLTQFTTAFFAARTDTSWVSLVPYGHGGVGGDTMVWSGTQWYDAGFGQQIPTGSWTHVAFSVDSGQLTGWINGQRAFTGTGFPDVLTTETGVFSLATNWWDTPYKGAMDELRVYDSALTDAQVAELVELP